LYCYRYYLAVVVRLPFLPLVSIHFSRRAGLDADIAANKAVKEIECVNVHAVSTEVFRSAVGDMLSATRIGIDDVLVMAP